MCPNKYLQKQKNTHLPTALKKKFERDLIKKIIFLLSYKSFMQFNVWQ